MEIGSECLLLQQVARVHADEVGDLLERLQRQVALAALDGAHVRPVHADVIGEALLTVPLVKPPLAQVAPDDLL